MLFHPLPGGVAVASTKKMSQGVGKNLEIRN